MLKGFYTSIGKKEIDGGFEEWVKLNPSHVIYQVHFPGNPITPGVCILQMCQELLAVQYGKTLRMKSAKNIKFLNVLNPLEHAEVRFSVKCSETGTGLKAVILISDGEVEFAKVSTEYGWI